MQWQRLLGSAVVGVAALGCESAPVLRAAAPPADVRLQKADGDGKGIMTTSLAPDPAARGRPAASIRALVNGHPIFEDEVNEAALAPLSALHAPSEEELNAEVKKIRAATLEQLIERELLVQEARAKLLKAGKKDVLEKVTEEADGQFQRWAKQAAAGFKNDEEFKNYLKARGTSYEGQKRLRERIFLAEEYLRSNVMRYVDRRTGHQEVLDYYRGHPEEFQRADSVQWQDVFIDTARYSSSDAARRVAEDLRARASAGDGDDFVRLCEQYDNGLARTKKAAGIGTKREDISPPEAAAVLFQMRDGEVGPIVAVPAGFHVIRLAKRTYAGIAPFNEEAQKAIKEKLRNEYFALESKRFMEELKKSATIERFPAP